jgi:pyruvate/2-oxoglutarate dehydrogenase complex dihydrolipoamide dehydrogenase (E3) component
MWWDDQNLNKPRTDKSGTKWKFRVWHDAFTIRRTVGVARIFFWNETRDVTGVVLLGPDANQHVRDLHGHIEKLVADPKRRATHQRPLQFPLER